MNAIPFNLNFDNNQIQSKNNYRNKSFCSITTEFGDLDVKYKSMNHYN
jgi:uncharacterized protein affecting Mg2+/Co2+ transport